MLFRSFGRQPEIKRLSRYLSANKGRLINDFKFVNKVPKSGGMARWFVQKGDDPSVSAEGMNSAPNVRDIKF